MVNEKSLNIIETKSLETIFHGNYSYMLLFLRNFSYMILLEMDVV
jgi:hypothetical protein